MQGRNSRDSENEQPVATVTGLSCRKFGGLEPLTVDRSLTRDEVRRDPLFNELEPHPEQDDENLIIDVIHDTMSPMRLQDLYRGTDTRTVSGSGRTGPAVNQSPPHPAHHPDRQSLGFVADPEELHAVWYGMPNTIGVFELPELTDIERLTYDEKQQYFWFGEVGMAAMPAGSFAATIGIFMAGRTDTSLAFIGPAVPFLPLFVFLPKLIQREMTADTDAAIEAFGTNELVKKVFWTFSLSMAGLVLARVVDPVTAHQIVGLITGMGV